MTLSISVDTINLLWPHGDSHIPGLRQAIAEQSEAVFKKWGFDTPDVIAIFMGQVSLECGGGVEVVENLNYSARRLTQVWPHRFPSLASAVPFANNPQALANKVYNGRMGNRAGSDDGWTYRGRGGSQTTGHDGYAALAAACGLDLLSDPDLVNDPRYFLDCAAADFVTCGCLPFARRGDIEGVTHHLNGGFNGLADRKTWTARWRVALNARAGSTPFAPHQEPNTNSSASLHYGARGFEVEALQQRLVELGYHVGRVDRQYGRATRAAVFAFKADRGLAITDEIDAATREALQRDLAQPVAEERAQATPRDLREAGSETVAKADQLGWYGKLAAGLGLAGGGGQATQKLGVLDTVKGTADQLASVRVVVEQIQDLGGWIVTTLGPFWWIGALGAGVVAVRLSGDIIAHRLADHRAGANLKH